MFTLCCFFAFPLIDTYFISPKNYTHIFSSCFFWDRFSISCLTKINVVVQAPHLQSVGADLYNKQFIALIVAIKVVDPRICSAELFFVACCSLFFLDFEWFGVEVEWFREESCLDVWLIGKKTIKTKTAWAVSQGTLISAIKMWHLFPPKKNPPRCGFQKLRGRFFFVATKSGQSWDHGNLREPTPQCHVSPKR